MYTPVSKQSLSEVVFDQIRDQIVSKELKAGDELPSERVLSEMLQVSRNAVREALKRLQQSGLVHVRHGGTTMVLDYQAEASPDLLPSLLVDAERRIRPEVARSIVRMRQVLSPEIAADAATNANSGLADRLKNIAGEMQECEDARELQAKAFSFWEALAEGSGNIAYRLAFNSLRKTYNLIWDLMTPLLSKDQMSTHYFSEIAEAVGAGDRASAMSTAKEYIDKSSTAIYEFLDRYEQYLKESEK